MNPAKEYRPTTPRQLLENSPADEGKKYDRGKVRLELVPPDAIAAMGRVLTFGAEKYGAWNWTKGMAWSRIYGAVQRHLTAWYAGAGADDETGLSHLDHALCCLAFLATYEARDIGTDDRPELTWANSADKAGE
jgi:hypothetical protein